jgi:hypothetical protein
MSIAENILKIRLNIPSSVKLIAVSKTKPMADIMEAYAVGQRAFGENKAQEMAGKHHLLPSDIEWHFIGHLQRNKVKYIAPFVSLIHSVDSLPLLAEIDREGGKHQRVISCLLQLHIADEETKFGLNPEEANQLLASEVFKSLRFVRIAGVMGMATYTEEMEKIRGEFRYLKSFFENLKETWFKECDDFREISMGMSSDYPIAIEEGSTIVRIGSNIFGERNYIRL